jgi:hypothetical protein
MEYEIKQIQKDFNTILLNTQDNILAEDINTDALFEEWEKNKKYFIKKFGGLRVISEEKTSFALTTSAKHHELFNFLREARYTYKLDDLAGYLDCISVEEFFANKITHRFYYGNRCFEVGQKVLKGFKFFVNQDMLEMITQKAAMLIQKNSTEGYMCLSVHPLDFISLSDNNYNWTSCLSAQGEYRGGITSYMCDPSTVIAYIISEDEKCKIYKNCDVEWYNKKWRELLYFNETYDIVIQSKPYPYMLGDDSINNGIDELLDRYGFIHYGASHHWECQPIGLDNNGNIHDDYNDYMSRNPYLKLGTSGGIISMKFLIKSDGLAYNDIILNTGYMFKYRLLSSSVVDACCGEINTEEVLKRLSFHMNKLAPCISCGQAISATYSDSLLCNDCLLEKGIGESQDIGVCSYCGDPHDYNDMRSIGVGDWVCDNCFNDNFVECSICGDILERDNAHWFDDEPYCDYCIQEVDKE